MTILNRDAILAAQDLKTEDVAVPEWAGSVRVRALTGTERDAFAAMLAGADGKPDLKNYRVKLIATCVVGEDGARLFTEADVEALGGKSAAAIERVFMAADKLNSLSEQAVETAEKN